MFKIWTDLNNVAPASGPAVPDLGRAVGDVAEPGRRAGCTASIASQQSERRRHQAGSPTAAGRAFASDVNADADIERGVIVVVSSR